MNGSLRLVVLALAGIGFFGGSASAQGGPDGKLNDMLSPRVFGGDPRSDQPDFLFRNRYEGDWLTTTADTVIMTRVGPRSVSLLQDAVPPNPEVLNTRNLNFNWEIGPKVNFIAHEILFGQDVEAGYFGIDGFNASQTRTALAGHPIQFNVPTYPITTLFPGDAIRFDYVSRIHSAEINGRFYIGDRLALLAGFRWVDLHEDLAGTGLPVGGGDFQFIDINVDNHLYGGQIGLDVSLLDFGGPFRLDGTLKAGVFGNFADQTVTSLLPTDGNKITHTAFLGELSLVAVYEITPHILLRGGYQVMWLEGVALAGDQPASLDFIGGDFRPDVRGSLFYHGAFAGLEVNF